MNLQKLQKQSYVRIIMGFSILCSMPSAMVEELVTPTISTATASALSTVTPSTEAAISMPAQVEASTLAVEAQVPTERPMRRSLTPTRMMPTRMMPTTQSLAAMSPFNTTPKKPVQYVLNLVDGMAQITEIRPAEPKARTHIMVAAIQEPLGVQEAVPYSALVFFPLAFLMAQKKRTDPKLMAHYLESYPQILDATMSTIYLLDIPGQRVRDSGLAYQAEDEKRRSQAILKAQWMLTETTYLLEAPVINYAALEECLSKNPLKLTGIDREFIEADQSSALENVHFVATSKASELDKWLVLMYAKEHTKRLAKKAKDCEKAMAAALQKAEQANGAVATLKSEKQALELQIERLMNQAASFAEQQGKLEDKLKAEYEAGMRSLKRAESLEGKLEEGLGAETASFERMSGILQKLMAIVDSPDPQSKKEELRELVKSFEDEQKTMASAGRDLDKDSKELFECLEQVFAHAADTKGIMRSGLHLLRAGFGFFAAVFSPLGLEKAIQDVFPKRVAGYLVLPDSTREQVRVLLASRDAK